MRSLILIGLVGVLCAVALFLKRSPSESAAEEGKPSMRVLFIGNSFCGANDMPQMIRHLAEGQARRFVPVLDCPGGCTLRSHWEGAARGLLERERWDFVVLQEQSQLPSFDAGFVAVQVLPYARQLHAAAHGRTLLFMTWGYRGGDRDNRPTDTYEAMQGRITAAYETLAADLHAPLAPVGRAWGQARAAGIDLWGPDGKHPNEAGSYLAACVLFRAIYGHGVTGNPYTAGLTAARRLQQIADQN